MTDDNSEKPENEKIKRLEDQLADQLKRANQTKAKIRDEKSKLSKAARKLDTRRCIIAGRYALQHIEANPDDDISKKFKALLDEYVTAEKDRGLFDFLNQDNLKGKFPDTE